MKRVTTITLPENVAEYVSKWEKGYMSNKSKSIYSQDPNYNGFTNGCLRVSDHWNFSVDKALRCKTTTKVDRSVWYVAKYDNGRWEIIHEFEESPKARKKMKNIKRQRKDA